MNYDIARERLLSYANLTHGLSYAPDEESLLFVLWDAHKSKVAPDNLATLAKDIVACLEVVSKRWNGAVPSETFDNAKETDLDLVSAMSQIIHSCWEYFREWEETQFFEPQILQQFSLTAWNISCAWNAVPAGNIDEIAKDVEYEKWYERSDLLP